MQDIRNINSLFKSDGSLGETFYILEHDVWKGFDATYSNIEKILAGKHPCFKRTKLSPDEIAYLNEGLRLLKSN